MSKPGALDVRRSLRAIALAGLALTGCDRADHPPLFELLPPERTGVTFVNGVPDDDPEFNIVNYLNYYNGGGVAVGDVNNDGLPDLYFTANRGPNRLYLNLGDYRFRDVTDSAGVAAPLGWATGATMADVNGDGWLDIYVSAVTYRTMPGGNVLYINNGDGTFTDRTDAYGLGHAGYGTQAALFDYDGDGDLDVYLLNHAVHEERGPSLAPQREPRHPRAGDRLLRNDGNRFVDASEQAGIYGGVEGYGLGVVVSDLNLDGCPDIYVANDFQENDFLYYNNCDGTFTEAIGRATGHTSHSSMGVDAADLNNDGRPDVVVLDMLPERQDILATSASVESFRVHHYRLTAGYHPQYPRNTLQLNRGLERFSEIGYLAGIHATDWSWAPLLVDLDNDGLKDLVATNGIYRRPNDLDYQLYIRTRDVQAALEDGVSREELAAALELMPHVPIANYAFRNNGDLTFSNQADPWGLGQPFFSTGAAYADLNNSGALDLVMNNINAAAAIYRNRARTVNGHRYLRVRLRGAGRNTTGIGTKVIVTADGRSQLLEQIPTRGFQSSVDHTLHFGLGISTRVDSLVVIWPDHRYQILKDVPVDQTVTLEQDDAGGRYEYGWLEKGRGGQSGQGRGVIRFEDLSERLAPAYRHEENTFFEYTLEPLVPHQLSTEGPALAVGDVNGDGIDDLYVGGAKWQPGHLFLQSREGGWRRGSEDVFRADSLHEDVDAAFFDADADGDLDLYVVSAGNEFWGDHEALADRLYRNDGSGRFERARDALPPYYANGCCVVPGDFDGDGHVDLFVGARTVPREYGTIPRSVLLRNDGQGRFVDVTAERAPGLARAGMVAGAAWTDYDGDGQLDLVVVGEWMPVRVFRQRAGRFEERTAAVGLALTNGWWNTVVAADLTGDGRPDLVLGNLGRNSYLRASRDELLRLYVHHGAGPGGSVAIPTMVREGGRYPLATRDELLAVIPALRERYPTYAAFGARRIEDVLSASELRRAAVLEAYVFTSAVAVNTGDGTFVLQPLPVEAQFAPVYAALVEDLDGDAQADLVLGGNLYGAMPLRGRYDASYGVVLRGHGDGGFTPVDLAASRLVIDGQVRAISMFRSASGERLVMFARNNDRLKVFRVVR